MVTNPLVERVLFRVGPVGITTAVVTTWVIIATVGTLFAVSTTRMALQPGRWQSALELLVVTIKEQIEAVLRRDAMPFLPLLGALFIFLVVANSISIVPGLKTPTAHLETAAALGAVVYVATHVFGIRMRGIRRYLKSYIEPTPLLLPLNILSEITRTFSLTIRLFGNVMSGEFVTALVLALAGLLLPVPLMALDLVTDVLQAYIFTTLATVFMSGAIGAVEKG